LIGLGIDEATAVAVEGDGSARVLTAVGGKAWVVRPRSAPAVLEAGRPLTADDVEVLGLGTGSRLQLPAGEVIDPEARWSADVHEGKLSIDRGAAH
jgi:cyanophycinase-like exopeptidase